MIFNEPAALTFFNGLKSVIAIYAEVTLPVVHHPMGSWMINIDPSPSFVSTFISPPCALIIS